MGRSVRALNSARWERSTARRRVLALAMTFERKIIFERDLYLPAPPGARRKRTEFFFLGEFICFLNS